MKDKLAVGTRVKLMTHWEEKQKRHGTILARFTADRYNIGAREVFYVVDLGEGGFWSEENPRHARTYVTLLTAHEDSVEKA